MHKHFKKITQKSNQINPKKIHYNAMGWDYFVMYQMVMLYQREYEYNPNLNDIACKSSVPAK